MSTRCNIIITEEGKSPKVYLYQHHDGYPDGVGKEFREMVGKYISDHCDWSADSLSKYVVKADPSYRYTEGVHGDVEYIYTLSINQGEFDYACYKCYGYIDALCHATNPLDVLSTKDKVFDETLGSTNEKMMTKDEMVDKYFKEEYYKVQTEIKHAMLRNEYMVYFTSDECHENTISMLRKNGFQVDVTEKNGLVTVSWL